MSMNASAWLRLATSGSVGIAMFVAGYYVADLKRKEEIATINMNFGRAVIESMTVAAQRLREERARADQAERAFVDAREQHADEVKTLNERIADVSTTYKHTAQAAPVELPRCVFTRGWLRDYNLAFGVPADRAGAIAAAPGQASDAAAGADTWLLDSGLTQSDILAHAIDYGAWCRGLAAQVDGLIDLRDGEKP